MPQFRPAQARAPRSKIRVPFAQRQQKVPHEDDQSKPDAPLLWARRLPYQLVQGSHIGHGIRMEPSRKVPFAGQYA